MAISLAAKRIYPVAVFVSLIIVGPALGAPDESTSISAAATGRPNFVFFLVDDMGVTDVGCYGSTFYETPNIDALAQSGAKFTAAYSACPVCSPSRAAYLTGKYPPRVGVTDYLGSPQPNQAKKKPGKKPPQALLPAEYQPFLDLKEITIAEALKQAGYSTFMAGKWHLGGEDFSPEKQGFDVVKLSTKGAGDDGGKEGPQTDKLTSETIDFIRSHADQPFFAYVSYYAVHRPVIGRPELVRKYEAKAKAQHLTPQFGVEGDTKELLNQSYPAYAAMVEEVDESVGSILNTLDGVRVASNTVVIFTSDNGGLSTGNGAPTANLGVRAGKGWLYEGGIRVPLLVRWPGVTEAGMLVKTPTIGTDFYPTMLRIAVLPLMPEQHKDGLSVAAILKNGDSTAAPLRPLFWHFPHYGANNGGKPGSAVRLGKWKLIKWYEGDRLELFDLQADPEEQMELSTKYPDVVKDLTSQLEAWLKKVDAKFPTPNVAYKP